MRLVLDTNIVVSAALWGGKPRQVLEEAHGNHVLCFSLSTLQELLAVLQYPKLEPQLARLSFSIEEFLERLIEHAIIIADPPEEQVITDDSSDNKFLACAVACKAQVIVSGDQHLLALKKYEGIPILTAKAAIKKLLV